MFIRTQVRFSSALLFRTQKRHSLISDRHPDIPNRHPDIPNRHPDIPNRHPDISNRHPDISNRHPDISNRQPNISDLSPGISIKKCDRPSVKSFLSDQRGLNTVELVVIIAIVIGLALLFRGRITTFVTVLLDGLFSDETARTLVNGVKVVD